MKTALMIAAGVAALSLAACNKPASEPAADTTMSATPMAASDSAMSSAASSSAPSDSAMSAASPSSGAAATGAARNAGTGATSQRMAQPTTTTMSGAPVTSAVPTAQETMAATKGTLSPAGASSGATAPAPVH